MKCSSRRNCNTSSSSTLRRAACLNEVQFPKELQHCGADGRRLVYHASMKCSSRRNCNAHPAYLDVGGILPQ